MADEKRPWEQKLHEAGTKIEEDLKRLVAYLNDEVVPDVRRSGSEALRAAAAELHRLAERMEDGGQGGRGPVPPPPVDTTRR